MIGQQDDRDATLRALGHAMPFVRHELGRRLRIRRIPELHVRLDDSAERGTRLLHLLHELEVGTDPAAIVPPSESLPTPVPRLPHEGDADEPLADASPADAEAGPATKRPPAKRPASRRAAAPRARHPAHPAGRRPRKHT